MSLRHLTDRVDIATIAGTAPTTAGKIDVKGADGDVFVRQGTGTSLHMVVDSGTVTTVSTVTNLSQMSGAAISMGTGVRDSGTQRVTIATNDAVPVTDNAGSLTVDAPVATPVFVRLSDGAAAIATLPVSIAGTVTVTITPATTGGLTTFHLVSAGSANATVVKASAGQLFGWYIYNSTASMKKVAFHNSASTPTDGASIFFSLPIPPYSASNIFTEQGIAFSSGIGITTVTGIADSDATDVSANDLVINLFYK